MPRIFILISCYKERAVSGVIWMECCKRMQPIRVQYFRAMTNKRACSMAGMQCRDAPNYCPDIEECSIKERLP